MIFYEFRMGFVIVPNLLLLNRTDIKTTTAGEITGTGYAQ
jgi:hypothetical protein